MDLLYPNCAGLDVHKDTVVACSRRFIAGKVAREVRTFKTTTGNLLSLSEWLASLGCTAIVTHHRLMDAALIERAHAAGLRALVYTVNDAESAQTLIDQGIDGIVTDAVDRFSATRRPGR